MASRLSTAEILAAARAADGKHSADGPPVKIGEPSPRDASAPESPTRDAATSLPAATATAEPPTIAGILREVRGEREERGTSQAQRDAGSAPPSMQSMLETVRGGEPRAVDRPVSMESILRQVRELCGTNGRAPSAQKTEAKPNSAPADRSSSRPAAKPSTSSILAAARAQGGASSKEGTKVAAPSSGKATSTADILAAARRQGAATGGPAKAAIPRPKKTATDRTPSEVTSASAAAPPTDDRPRPPQMGELLAAVRSSATEQNANIVYPPIAEMVRELRGLDRRGRSPSHRRDAGGWLTRIRNWFSDGSETHQGASI